MKPTIAIVTALLVEFEAVWSVLEDAEELKIGFSNAKCVVGKIPARGGAQHEVLLVQLRMGMKRNEVTAQELQNQFADIDAVFAVGLGAGISTGESDEAPARLGDIVVCDSEVPIREDREGWRKVVYHKSRPQSERLLIALQERQFAKGQEYFPYDIFDEAKTKLGWDLPDVPADVRIVHGTTGLFRGGVKNPESLRKFDRKIVAVSEGFLGPLSDAEKGYLRVLGICDEAKKKNDRWHQYSAVAAAAYARSVIELMAVRKTNVRIFLVPYPRNNEFYGRDGLLHDMRNILSAGAVDPSIVFLVGPAGIGKTQIALQYAHMHRDEYDAVFWVSSDSSIRLQESYREIANTLDLKYRESQLQDFVPRVNQWLSETPNWLLIVDNADDLEIVVDALPRHGRGHVIVTSRNSTTSIEGKKLTVPQFSTEESVEFLMRSIKANESETNVSIAKTLAAQLRGFPLALELASAYMRTTGASFERYLELFKRAWHNETSQISDVLKQHDGFAGIDNASITTSLVMNLQEVANAPVPLADLLRLTLNLKPDSIPFSLIANARTEKMLNEFFDQSDDPTQATVELLRRLADYAIITVNAEESSFSINRLLKELLQNQVSRRTPFFSTDAGTFPSYSVAKVVLVGDRGTGKTALAMVLSTVGFDSGVFVEDVRAGEDWQTLIDNQLAEAPGIANVVNVPHHGSKHRHSTPDRDERELVFAEVRGTDENPQIESMMLCGASAVLLLVDPSGKEAISRARAKAKWISDSVRDSDVVIYLVVTKVDSANDKQDFGELQRLADEFGLVAQIETSAFDERGIAALRSKILQEIHWEKSPRTITKTLFEKVLDVVVRQRKSGKTFLPLQDVIDDVHAISSISPADKMTLIAMELLEKTDQCFRGDLPDGRVVFALRPELVFEYAERVLHIAKKSGSYNADWLTWHNWSDEESIILHCTVQLMADRGLCYRDGNSFVFPAFQSAHASDKSMREARQLLAEGKYEDAHKSFLHVVSEYPEFGPFLRDELGFVFDFDANLASEQAKWQSRQGQIEWRRRVWAVVAQHDIKLAQQVETANADTREKRAEADKAKEKPVNDGKKAKVRTMTSEEKGEALEQAVEELFRFLFRVDDVDSLFETFELSQQQRGLQFGFDIKLVFVDKRTGARVRCFFECKAQEDKITLNTVAEKVAAIDTFQSQPDHWVLIAPRAVTQNGLKNVIDDWDDRDKYDFDIQLWTKGNQTEELFGLVPKLYDLWFEDVPDDERIDPSKWSDEKRNQIAAKWRNKLEAPLRLPVGWPDYVRDHRHLKTFSDESDEVLDELRSRHIEPRGLDETGAPLPEDLEATIENWLESSTRSLILLGDFGDGKTAATYLISLRLVNRFRVNPKESWLPLRCSLRDFSREGVRDGRDFLRRRVEEFKADVAGWQHLAKRHKAFVILDGLDEMTTALDPGSVQSAIDRLLDCCREEFRDLKILLTCRTPFFHAMPERDYLLGELESPVIITMRNFERRDILDKLTEQATTPAHRQRLQALRTMHDPIGLAGKPLFFQMVSETLWDPDSDCSNAVGLYESYIRKSLLRKVDLLRAETQRISREELVGRLFRLLELVAVEIHRGKQEFACLKKIATRTEDVEYARLLWKHSNASDVVEHDATARLGIRSLLRRVDLGDEDGEDEFWPVDFCHRSMREFFVAKTLERVIRESTSKAKELLAKTDLSIETIRFAALLIRRESQPAKYHAPLRALAEQSRKQGSDLSDSERARLGKNAVTLLFQSEVQLSGVDWSNMALDGVDLAGADLSNKDFSGTSLRHAILENANFSDANFSDADLTGVLLEETAEIQSISVIAGGDEFVAAYADGRIRRWSLDRSIGTGSNVTYEQDTQAKRLDVSSVPGSDLCLQVGNQLIFADQSDGKHVRRGDIRTQSDIARLAFAESGLLVVRERRDSSYIAELFDLALALPVKLYSVSIGSSWLCSAFATKALAFVVDAEVVVQLLGKGTRTTICKMQKLSALSIGNVSESEFLLGCGNQVGELKVIRCCVADDRISAEEVLASHPHDSAISSIAFIEDYSVLTGGNDRKIVRSDLRSETAGECLDTFALQLQCKGMNVTGLHSETERETLVTLGAKTYP